MGVLDVHAPTLKTRTDTVQGQTDSDASSERDRSSHCTDIPTIVTTSADGPIPSQAPANAFPLLGQSARQVSFAERAPPPPPALCTCPRYQGRFHPREPTCNSRRREVPVLDDATLPSKPPPQPTMENPKLSASLKRFTSVGSVYLVLPAFDLVLGH